MPRRFGSIVSSSGPSLEIGSDAGHARRVTGGTGEKNGDHVFRQRSRVIALLAAVVGALAVLTPSAAVAAVGDQPPLSSTRTPSTLAWGAAVIDLPWTAAALPDGATCPGGRIAFTANGGNPQAGTATVGDRRYTITLVQT